MTTKVLYTAFDVVPSPKGASRHITHFTQSLVAAGYEVTLFTAGLADMPAAETYAGARIIRHRSEETNFLRRAHLFGDAVWEHLRDKMGAYDVVHFRDIWSGGAALKARQQLGYSYRTLFEVNGLPSVELKYHYPALQDSDLPRKLKAQEKAIVGGVEAIVCVSTVTAIYLQSIGACRQQITVIPNGVEPALFGRIDRVAVKPPRLVYAGTLTTWQGISTVIEAMPTILAACPDAELHLVGPIKNRYQKGLLKLATKVGLDEENLRFVGPVSPEKMPEQLARASVCLAPLTYNDRNVTQGCCPIKLLEYAAAGRPIVAADLPVVRELLGEGEALFFQPGDSTNLARQVIYLLSPRKEAQAMGERAARRVREAFTWERAGRQLLALYDQLNGREQTHTQREAPRVHGAA